METKQLARRARFLLREAKAKDGVRDQTVTYAMRVISNVRTVESDGGPRRVKRKNKWVSQGALALLDQGMDEKDWHEETTNEHWWPLRHVWDHLKRNAARMSVCEVVELFDQYPMVVITREENKKLRKVDKKPFVSPEDRYKRANIVVMERQF